MSELVHEERCGDVRVWTIDSPRARNAIDGAVADALAARITDAENDPALRAVILTGAGDAVFCAGADLKLLSGGPEEERAAVDARVHALLARLEALPLPVIGALNGVAMGGGCEVALACDLRIAEAHASVTFKHAAMSVTPGWGGLARLARVVGPGIAAKLLFTALPMTADEALRVGLFDEVVPKGKARARALALCAAISETSPSAVANLKWLLQRSYGGVLTDEEERRVFLARTVSDDHREALAAFVDKRTPRFGRRA